MRKLNNAIADNREYNQSAGLDKVPGSEEEEEQTASTTSTANDASEAEHNAEPATDDEEDSEEDEDEEEEEVPSDSLRRGARCVAREQLLFFLTDTRT